MHPGEVAAQLADANARFVLTAPAFAPTARAAVERACGAARIIMLGPAPDDMVPIPDERAGERPKAYVAPARRVGEPELIEYMAARVAPHKRIHEVAFIDAIPTSPSGKTLRRLLVADDRAKATGQRE